MQTNLVGAVLARNESDRFLRPVLTRLREVCDTVLLLDDRSTDDTPAIAHELGCTVRIRRGERMWGAEAPARAELWDWASHVAQDGWVLICDADMELVGDPRPLLDSWEVNSWAWVLYDIWGDGVYREDQFWRGHQFPRVWMVRPLAVRNGSDDVWLDRGLHAGHFPINLQTTVGLASNLYWKHWCYSTPELRAKKHAQYTLAKEHLTTFERQHAESIIEYDQNL